jgi:hypothetical protein
MLVAFFFKNQRGVSTPRLAVIASGLAFASLIGVRVLEAPLASRNQVAIAAENQTDLERLARAVPAAKARISGSPAPAARQSNFTATANSGKPRCSPPAMAACAQSAWSPPPGAADAAQYLCIDRINPDGGLSIIDLT